ncbi:efflux RND transporter periplasmic adaptor subunit [Gluconobacter sp.]|uniref:efflux RND transporter periplasmic adaptor subunit n=1 Tax=Gluconobacter sp. TaxID=1876758 RepID=UPI0039ED4D08
MRVTRVGALAIGLLCLAILLVFVLRLRTPHPPIATAEPPMVTQLHGRFVVREGSPLEKRLIVQAVESLSRGHGLLLPAQVMTEPDRQVNVYAPVTGRITGVSVHLGQRVRRGQVLATIAAGDLDQAWADDTRARAALDFARRAYTRAQGVQAIGGNAVKDLESARNDLAQAQAEAERTQRRLQVLGARPGYSAQGQAPLVSPVDGVVSMTTMAPGENITDPTAIQMTVLDLSEVWIAAAIPQDSLAQISDGNVLSVSFDEFPGRTCSGRVVSFDPALHADTRRVNAYIACPNADGLLRPGMFVDATLNVPQGNDVIIPKTALLMNNDQVSVFVETAPRTFQRRDITISYDEGDDVRVLKGLSAGERVVTSGAILLNDD